MENPVVLGVDIGGTHITAAIVDLEKGLLIQNSITRNTVDSRKNKEEILTAWCEVINASSGKHISSISRIGIAMPGPFDYEKGVSLIKAQDKFDSLYLVKIKEELAKKLNLKPSAIRLINDAAAFMQGEVVCGAAKGYHNVLGLTLGTGLGSAISANGLAHDAALWNSKFKEGIAEDYLSTRWFIKKYAQLTGKVLKGVKELAFIAENDENAMHVFKEFAENLSDFLQPLIKEHESEIVILGGNIAQSFSLFSKTLKESLIKTYPNIIIKTTELNEHAALIGAATCWKSAPEIS